MSQDIVPVPALEQPGEFPTTADRTAGTYNSKAIGWAGRLAAFGQSIVDIANSAWGNAGVARAHAQESAQQASYSRQYASDAVAARDAVWGASNFKGLWSDLAGSLLKPATVKHGERFWLLVEDLSDVAQHEPGVSSAWISLDAGVRPQQSVAAGAVACVPGVTYIITGADVTLTAPATGLIQGDVFAFRLAAPVSGTQCVDFGSVDVRSQSAGLRFLDKPGFALDLQFNTERGWV